MIFKNIANQILPVLVLDSSGDPVTGDAANITCQLSIDGGVSAATNDTNPTELDATNHPGVYLFTMTQAETNGNLLIFSPVSSSGYVIDSVIIWTEAAILSNGSGTIATSLGTSGGLVRGQDTDSLDDVADAVHDEVIENSLTSREINRIVLAVLAGKSNTNGTVFRDNADGKNRVTATVDANGNRSAITLDGSE
jgi:hypothetical protein